MKLIFCWNYDKTLFTNVYNLCATLVNTMFLVQVFLIEEYFHSKL